MDLLARTLFNRRYIDTRRSMLELLLEYGLDVTIINSEAQNILHIFIRDYVNGRDQDAVEITQMLIDHGVSTNQVDRFGWKPMHYVIKKNSFNNDLYRFLLSKSNDFSYEEKILILELIVRSIPDINYLLNKRQTLLHRACFWNREMSIKFFLSKGASVNVLNAYEETPFSLLDPENDNYDTCKKIMVKELARLRFENIPITELDLEILYIDEKTQEFFENCLKELKEMSLKKFYRSYSYYFILKTSQSPKKLAKLTKNKDFVAMFERNVSVFQFYKDNLQFIFDKAIQVRNKLIFVETKLNKIFGQYLPEIVIKKLSKNLTLEDLPLS